MGQRSLIAEPVVNVSAHRRPDRLDAANGGGLPGSLLTAEDNENSPEQSVAHNVTTQNASGVTQRGDVADRIEQTRSFNAAVALVPQAVAGMGGEEKAARLRAPPRLRGDDRHTPHHHPEELAALAGANEIVEYRHQYKFDLNQARALSTGTAYFISRRHATKARVIQAPQPATSALPNAPGAPGAGGSDHDRARVGTASRTHAPY